MTQASTARRAGLAVLAVALACARPPELPPAVATFGADAVRVPEFKAELDRARAELKPRGDNAAEGVPLEGDQLRILRRAVLGELVDRRLLLAEAQKAGVAVTDRELDDALRGRAALALEPDLPRGEAQEALRRRTRDALVIDRFLTRSVAARIAIAPDEARAWFDAHPEDYLRPEQVHCAQLLVPKREDAEALKVQLNRGADFTKVARAQSMSDDRSRGGDLGWFGKGQMPPEFEQACVALRKGQVSEVVQTPYGFHLFKLLERRDGVRLPFSEVEATIDLQLRRERVSKAQAELVEKLRQQAGVVLVETELDKVP